MLFSFFCALFSKEQAAIFLPLVLFFEILRRIFKGQGAEPDKKTSLKIVAGVLAVVIGYVLWKHFVVGADTILLDDHSGGIRRILSIPHILWMNFLLLCVPKNLHYLRSLDLFA